MDAEVGVQERARRGGVAEPAAHQDLGEDLAHAELAGEPPDGCERRRRDAPGAGIVHECITARVYRAGATDAAGGRLRRLAGPAGPASPAGGSASVLAPACDSGEASSAGGVPAMVTAVCSPASATLGRRRSLVGGLVGGVASPTASGASGDDRLGLPGLDRRHGFVARGAAAASLTTVASLRRRRVASSVSTTVAASCSATTVAATTSPRRGRAARRRRRARRQSLGLAQPLVGGLELGLELAPRAGHGRLREPRRGRDRRRRRERRSPRTPRTAIPRWRCRPRSRR